MSSLKRHEGYLLIDNRNLPALEGKVIDGKIFDPIGKNQLYESATITCSHCGVVVILRPDRSRPRGYCRKCDAYVCDMCDGKECFDFDRLLDMMQEEAFKASQK